MCREPLLGTTFPTICHATKVADHQDTLVLVANGARPVDVNRKLLCAKNLALNHIYMFVI